MFSKSVFVSFLVVTPLLLLGLRRCQEKDSEPGGIHIAPEQHAVVIDVNHIRVKFVRDCDRCEDAAAQQISLCALRVRETFAC
jgi:hypothetical protein